MEEESKFIRHVACPYCHSKDNVGEYEDHYHCFGCEAHWNKTEEEIYLDKLYNQRKDTRFMPEEIVMPGGFSSIPDRHITSDTCKKFGVRTRIDNNMVTEHYYPYHDKDGKVIAYKRRLVKDKQFSWTGSAKDSVLFGMNCFPKGGKYVTLCEGEMDCLAIYQMFGGIGAVVSLKNGSKDLKAVRDAYEWLDSFGTIIVCTDGDAPGRESAKHIADILPPGKTKIVKMPQSPKDANDFLIQGRQEEFKKLWWNAEDNRPEDVVNVGALYDRVKNYRKTHEYIKTPWAGLNELIQGTRAGQFVVLTAGSGQGKSSFMRAWAIDLLSLNSGLNVGCLFMEESVEETTVSLMSYAGGLNLKRPDVWDNTSEEQLKKYYDAITFGGRMEFFDPKENMTPQYIANKIRYMAVAKGCKIIFLDHLSILVDASDDVRRDLNKLCKDIHEMCVSLGITVISAIHLRKSQSGTDHESGAEVRLDDIKDSSSVKQLADIVISFERNGQSDVERIKNLTKVRVLKNRDFGIKGVACGLLYDKDSTRFSEIPVEALNGDAIFTENET